LVEGSVALPGHSIALHNRSFEFHHGAFQGIDLVREAFDFPRDGLLGGLVGHCCTWLLWLRLITVLIGFY
jgi:hypothetical protein